MSTPTWRSLAAASVLLAAGCRSPAGDDSAVAAGPTVARRIQATGRVEGWREADVISKIPGRVLRVVHGEGDQVAEGTPVVELESRDLAARVREADARATETALDLDRLRALGAQRLIAPSELDRARAEHATAVAALDQARATLEYGTIRAPFAGTVLRRFKEIGEGVLVNGPPDPLFRIADLSRLKVIAEVPEIDLGGLRDGGTAQVVAEAYPGVQFPARLARIGLAVGRKRLRSDDPRERLDEKVVEVELHLAADPRLLSGMTVDVVFEAGGA